MRSGPIGVDFDNTIVCYDQLFFDAALNMELVPVTLERSKKAVRDYVLTQHSNREWTLLQGEVYGPLLPEAPPYPDAVEFFQRCRETGRPVYIVSHKTRYGAAGPGYDLHQSAWEWLKAHGLAGSNGDQGASQGISFSSTRAEKIREIERLRCRHFVDDLPEVFAEPGFPVDVEKILFDPGRAHVEWSAGLRAVSWGEIARHLLATSL